MKPEEINALYKKAYSNVGPEQADLLWQSWAGRAANAWPALYRELMAARALRHRALNGDDHAEVSALMDEYDAARLETDK